MTDGTAAGRFLDLGGSDGGYMLSFSHQAAADPWHLAELDPSGR